jgi:hypothetical protein
MTRRATLLSITQASLFRPLRAAQSGRGRVAFCYSAVLDNAAMEWYTRFELVVTGGILARQETQKLLDRGCRPVAYEWSSAFYPGDPVSAPLEWQNVVLKEPDHWLLHPRPVGGGAAAPGRTAYWYDFANPEMVRQRASDLAGRIIANGYAGVFLDTLGFDQLPDEMRSEFITRHKGVDYDRMQGSFLASLRARLGPDRLIFSNQGYRQATHFLPHVNLDLTESYFTAVSGNATLFRPFNDSRRPWESIYTPMEQLVAPASRRFPMVEFVHLGYAGGTANEIRRAISYNYAAAKLWNHQAYLMMSSAQTEQDQVYFADLGRPVSSTFSVDERQRVAWREFENGLVALNQGQEAAVVPGGRHRLQDGPRGYIFLQ